MEHERNRDLSVCLPRSSVAVDDLYFFLIIVFSLTAEVLGGKYDVKVMMKMKTEDRDREKMGDRQTGRWWRRRRKNPA